jgi:ATP-dependent RNA helicase DDX35
MQGIDNMMTFHWLAPPPAETMVRALETLHALGALGDDARLTTPIGTGMADLPVEPMLSRALLAGAALGCACEVATIVAMLGMQSVWSTSGGDRRALAEAKSRFAVSQGDIATYLNVWQGWLVNGKRKRWARGNYVSFRAMLRAADVRAQLLAYLRRLGFPPASMSGLMRGSSVRAGAPETEETLTKVQKALTAGLFLNAACLTDEVSVNPANAEDSGVPVYRLVRSIPGTATEAVRLRVHPSSVLFRCRAPWVCFVTAQQSDAGWFEMQDVMSIEPDWLVEAAPHYFSKLPVATRPSRQGAAVPEVDRRQEHRMVF